MITRYYSLHEIKKIKHPLTICLGYFDGLHLGHQSLIKKAHEYPNKICLLTFDFLPKHDLANETKASLTPLIARQKILQELGVDYYIVLTFDNEVKNLTPIEFVNQVILKLNGSLVITGSDYHFGKMASGDVRTLNDLALQSNFKVETVSPVLYKGIPISTTRIDELLGQGAVEEARLLLGRYYEVIGTVVHGLGKGRLFGFPTANLKLKENYLLPKRGVYGVEVIYKGQTIYGMANVGVHPTTNELQNPIIELFLFDFTDTLYSESLTVKFCFYAREEIKFEVVTDLINQLKEDEVNIKKRFKDESYLVL